MPKALAKPFSKFYQNLQQLKVKACSPAPEVKFHAFLHEPSRENPSEESYPRKAEITFFFLFSFFTLNCVVWSNATSNNTKNIFFLKFSRSI